MSVSTKKGNEKGSENKSWLPSLFVRIFNLESLMTNLIVDLREIHDLTPTMVRTRNPTPVNISQLFLSVYHNNVFFSNMSVLGSVLTNFFLFLRHIEKIYSYNR